MTTTLPPGLQTVTVTTGRAASHLGDVVRVVAAITPTHDLVHAATGDVLVAFTVEREAREGQVIAWELPATDQPGILTTDGDAITGWAYTIVLTYTWPTREGVTPRVIRRVVAPVMGQGVVDLDTLPTTEPAPEPIVAVVPAVTSVDGRTGAVDLLDRYTPRVEGLGADLTVIGRDALGQVVAVNSFDDTGGLVGTTVLVRDPTTDALTSVVETYTTHTVTTTLTRDALGAVTSIERTTDYAV